MSRRHASAAVQRPVRYAAGDLTASAPPSLQVSDIKRANGMLADNAMFGKDTLLIPTRPLPVGYDPGRPAKSPFILFTHIFWERCSMALLCPPHVVLPARLFMRPYTAGPSTQHGRA